MADAGPVLSLAIIPLLIVPIVADLSPGAEQTIWAIDWLIWAVFALEYGVRLCLAPRKGEFVRHGVIDLVVVLVPSLTTPAKMAVLEAAMQTATTEGLTMTRRATIRRGLPGRSRGTGARSAAS